LDVAELARLRLDLANQGVRLGDDLIAEGFALAFGPDQGSEGLDLLLPGGWWTNVCIAPDYARTSPWELVAVDDGLVLRHRARNDLPVELADTTRFRRQRTLSGIPCGDIGAVHGRWLVVAPFAPREGLGLDRPRRFLGVPAQRLLGKGQWSVDEVVTCCEAAWRHAGIRLVHFEAGHVLRDDGGVEDLSPYIAALRRALPVLISVNILPPSQPADVLGLYAAGCDAISYHLLAWDEASAAAVAPIRARFVDHQRILAALDAAARIYPPGAVSTDLLVGLEPLSHVETALEALIATGVVPNLAVFRPLPGAEEDAPHGELVPTEPLLALMESRLAQLRATPMWRSRVRGFPRTLAGFDRYSPSRGDRWYAGLRRRLRVVEVV